MILEFQPREQREFIAHIHIHPDRRRELQSIEKGDHYTYYFSEANGIQAVKDLVKELEGRRVLPPGVVTIKHS